MTDTQGLVLIIEVGVIAGVSLLSWLGLGPRGPRNPPV